MMKVLKKMNQQLIMLLCLMNEMNWKLKNFERNTLTLKRFTLDNIQLAIVKLLR